MSKLLLLLKTDFIITFKLNKLKTTDTLKKILIVLVSLGIITCVFSSMGMYTYLGTQFFMKYGLEKYILPIVYFICSFVIFYTTIYRAKSYLFSSDDSIFSMPIKSSTILASRLITLIILSYLVTTIVFVPAFIVYGVMLKLGTLFYIYSLISYIFIPFLPTILGCIIGYIIGYLTTKVNNKKIFETILTYATVLVIMYLSFNIQTLAMKFINNVEIINKILSSVGFLINSFMLAITQYSIKDLLIYVSTNVISILLFIGIFNKSYVKIVQNLKVEKTNNKYIEKKHIFKNSLTTLILKEFKMYFSIPIYILNTSFGVVLMLFASIATLFYDKDMLFKMMEIDANSVPIYLLLLGVIAFTSAVSNTAACSISIEGKNFWILKTMPIKIWDIFLSKIILNMLVVIPLAVLSIVIFGISLKLSMLQVLTVIILAIIVNIACSLFGIIINLKYPRLDFVSYTHIVKQSFSSFLGIMVPMVILFGLVSLYFVLNISIEVYILIIFALLLFSIMVQYNILKKWGIKKFSQIS